MCLTWLKKRTEKKKRKSYGKKRLPAAGCVVSAVQLQATFGAKFHDEAVETFWCNGQRFSDLGRVSFVWKSNKNIGRMITNSKFRWSKVVLTKIEVWILRAPRRSGKCLAWNSCTTHLLDTALTFQFFLAGVSFVWSAWAWVINSNLDLCAEKTNRHELDWTQKGDRSHEHPSASSRSLG